MTGARAFLATGLLRFGAFAVAIAGLVDPAITVSGVARPRIALVMPHPSSPEADEVRARLTRDLSASYEMVGGVTSDAAAAIAIGDRYPDEQLPESLLVATVTTLPAAMPGARIVRVDAPREVPPATAIHLDVEVEASDVVGQTTDVVATVAGLEVGRASHRWAANEKHWRASIEAVPVGEPPYVVRVAAATVRLKPDTTETTTVRLKPETADTTPVRLKPDTTDAKADTTETVPVVSGFSRTFSENVADVVVDLRREPIRVEFYDPRPSWATTFLRRALEADARFQVAGLSFTSRGVSVATGGAVPPGDSRLDGFEVVIVGGLDRLSAADAAALQRFMRERGGAIVAVPDQRIEAGPARDLISGGISGSVRLQPDLVERLLEQPAKLTMTSAVASLQASELLTFRTPPPGSDVVARVPGDATPVVVSMPRGDGRLLLSGAMDAWRFRAADGGAFDRFWQATIAGLALAVPPPIAITVDPPLLRPGEPGDVIVRVQARDVTAVNASIDRDHPLRLLPEPEVGVYRGRFAAKNTPGQSTIDVRVTAGQSFSGSRGVTIRSNVRRLDRAGAPTLAMLASSHRGIDVTPDRIAELERFLRNAVSPPRAPRTRHPMRSAWWIVPFALCLSTEWVLRRRRGLR